MHVLPLIYQPPESLARAVLDISVEGFKSNIRQIVFIIRAGRVTVYPPPLDDWAHRMSDTSILNQATHILTSEAGYHYFLDFLEEEYPIFDIEVQLIQPDVMYIQCRF
ncbi:hypothetical protein H4R33_000798 [Dimargaris cristalligena]|nr:hypothetical protein H4R33_000798 [Dimargaris cristalligena]